MLFALKTEKSEQNCTSNFRTLGMLLKLVSNMFQHKFLSFSYAVQAQFFLTSMQRVENIKSAFLKLEVLFVKKLWTSR
jgi:hypothetical protein